MQIISDSKNSDNTLKNKIGSFSKNLELESFFLLIKPNFDINFDTADKDLLESQIEKLTKLGFKNLEIGWCDNENWFNYVSRLKIKFPKLNLGSASIINKKSIDDSIKIGLSYSMMRFYDSEMLNYAKSKNHLLIPGINNIKDLKEAIDLDCKIIKIYPVKHKDKFINISEYKNIDFIAAGGLSISDVQLYKSYGYKAIVIGEKGLENRYIDPKIYRLLKEKQINMQLF